MIQTLAPWLVLAVALAGLAAWWWSRQARSAASPALGANDRVGAVAAISPVQWDMLSYLNQAFPGRPVLFRAGLSQLVAVRQAQNRAAAQQRLAQHIVDYVVCNRDGRPVYAFELDALHDNADEAEHDAREKHRVLKSAGIRLIRLTRSTRDLPDPNDFRRHVRSAELTPDGSPATVTAPGALAPADGPVPLPAHRRPHLTDDLPYGRAGGFRDTQPMTVTGLMDLTPTTDEHADAAADAWGIGRAPG